MSKSTELPRRILQYPAILLSRRYVLAGAFIMSSEFGAYPATGKGQRAPPMQTLNGLLENLDRQYGPRPALLYKPRYRTESWTYLQLNEQAGQMAAWLSGRGVEKGDRVVIWAPNSPWW